MRVVFLGTPEFAVPTLRELIADEGVEVVGVFTQPDRKAGRGQKYSSPPVKLLAERCGIPCFQFPSLRKSPEALEQLARLDPDILVVVAFGQILTREFFDLPPLGTLNVHASILPRYRGAAPVVHAILEGETETGITIMKIDEGMDTGDTLTTRETGIGQDMTAGELESTLSEMGAVLLLETIGDYASGKIEPQPQNHDLATYAPRIHREDGRLDWRESAAKVHDRVRAMNPWPGAFFSWKDKTVKAWASRVVSVDSASQMHPGTVLEISRESIQVSCGGGTVLGLLELQLPNKRRVSAREFANGVQLYPGSVLSES